MFATGVWSARGGKPALGVDIACTKISIDLQNMRRGAVDACIRDSLTPAGRSSDEEWYLVRPPAVHDCAAKGDAARAISYDINLR